MSKKRLKFKENLGLYRLHVSHAELQLIAKLVGNIRLGGQNEFSDAALQLLETINDHDITFTDTANHDIVLIAVRENDNQEIVDRIGPDNFILEINETYYPSKEINFLDDVSGD